MINIEPETAANNSAQRFVVVSFVVRVCDGCNICSGITQEELDNV